MQKIVYSCERKKDFVTFFAVAMFGAICIFELFLIFVLPVLLSRKDAMSSQVKKQEMIKFSDTVRGTVYGIKPKGQLQEGEVSLVLNCLDKIALDVRKNQNDLSPEMVNDLSVQLTKFYQIRQFWRRGRYFLQEEKPELERPLKQIEAKMDRLGKTAGTR